MFQKRPIQISQRKRERVGFDKIDFAYLKQKFSLLFVSKLQQTLKVFEYHFPYIGCGASLWEI